MSEPLPKRTKKDNGLTQQAFDQLLCNLGPDRERAAGEYIELRGALFTFFSFRGASNPDELIDETLDRAARRLNEGQSILTENRVNYFYGIAHNVWRESSVKANATTQLSEELWPGLSAVTTPYELVVKGMEARNAERRLDCLESCLSRLPDQERELVVAYYRDLGKTKIENRKLIAAQLGISLDSLRHKVARIRSKLGKCIKRCLKSQPPLA